MCSISGAFKGSESAIFENIVKLPGLSILGWQNKPIDPSDPVEANTVMQQILEKDWDITKDDVIDMAALIKDPAKQSHIDEMKSLDALR